MSTYLGLREQIAKLEAQAEEVRRSEITAVIAEIRQKIKDYGLTANDLGLSAASRRGSVRAKKAPLPPKFRNPRTGETWSGRGKPPKWIAGKNKERFLIAE